MCVQAELVGFRMICLIFFVFKFDKNTKKITITMQTNRREEAVLITGPAYSDRRPHCFTLF